MHHALIQRMVHLLRTMAEKWFVLKQWIQLNSGSQDICPSWILFFLKGLINLTFRILSFPPSRLQTSLLKYLPVSVKRKIEEKKIFKKVSLASGRKSVEVMPGDAPGDPDELFEKYSRKNPGGQAIQRNPIERPDPNGPYPTGWGNVTSGLAPYTGAWTEWEAAHLLRRVSFGWENWSWYAIAGDDFIRCGRCINELWRATLPRQRRLIIIKTRCRIAEALLYGASWTSNNLLTPTPMMETIMHFRQSSLNSWNWGLV